MKKKKYLYISANFEGRAVSDLYGKFWKLLYKMKYTCCVFLPMACPYVLPL